VVVALVNGSHSYPPGLEVVNTIPFVFPGVYFLLDKQAKRNTIEENILLLML
jgi:hypothetical protein